MLGQVRRLDQSVNYADPDVGWIPPVARKISGLKFAHDDRGARATQIVNGKSIGPSTVSE
jgi:hypothetical protein